ncbi:MAG: 16S rRNA (guanine(527)-N(7))-methyltransferase RsmG [Actinobacteria bacterium]|nr:16S rRNA (guanine(527)-N(7))-methyltransferase RsmG [Actinomycetota bacterium]
MDGDERLAGLVEAIRASPHNLVSPRAAAELESRHVPECLALARMLPDGAGRLVDVGSGGGLPGIVIAIARPDLRVTLVESTRKKADFLRATTRALELDVEVVNERAETLSGDFDLATARAVAPLGRLIPWVVPLLRPGGRLFAVKGERWREELEEAREHLERGTAHLVATPDEDRARDGAVDPPLRVVIIAAR